MSRESAAARIASLGRRSGNAVKLARVASLAVRIEPHLLRELRLRLVRDADVGTEADLWFSSLVESRGVDAIVLDRDVVAILRGELTGYERFEEVVSILAEAHRGEPSTITLEEQVNALAVRDGLAAAGAIDDALRAAIVAMRESDARAKEIARWFLRAAPRLHPIVQQCPNATALLLSASMLLGRRSPAEVPETRTTLSSFSWVIPPGSLDDRIEVGIERLPDAVRFVDVSGQIAVGAEGASTGRLSIPRAEPRLVEVAWRAGDAREQRVVEAAPGCVVMLDADASEVRVLTLAGDEYELLSIVGTEVLADDVTIDLEPYRHIVDACVQVRTIGESPIEGTAVRVHPDYVVTARDPFGRESAVGVTDQGGFSRCQVVPMPDYNDLVAVEAKSAGTRPVQLASAPFTATQAADQNTLERRREKAVVIGHDGMTVRGVEGEAEIDDFMGREFRVLVENPRPWLSGVAGGPVIIDGRVRGVVNAVHVPRMGDTAILSVIGAERIRDLLRRVVEGQQRANQVRQEAVRPEEQAPPPEPPPWLFGVCVAIRVPGADGEFATGLVLSDRVIVATQVKLRGAQTVTVLVGTRSIEARVLDGTSSGPLVFLGVASVDSFSARAPLIRASIRVRQAEDPPDPQHAMLVTARDGLRVLTIPNAARAGVVKARDPDGYRFTVVLSEKIVPLQGFEDAVLVWGDVVAGIVVPSSGVADTPTLTSNRPLTTLTAEILSVNVLKESLKRVTEAVDRLDASTTRLRAFISSTSGLQEHRKIVEERLRDLHIQPVMWEQQTFDLTTSSWSADTIGASDLFVQIVGDRSGPVLGEGKSATEFEYETAVRAGVDVRIFMQADVRVEDPQFDAWREKLRSRREVHSFSSLHELRERVAVEITRWQEERVQHGPRPRPEPANAPPVSGVGASAGELSALNECRVAKVVVTGPADGGKSVLLGQISGLHLDREQGRSRGILWLNRPPEVRAGLAFCESPSEEEWPLVLDLENAALVVIALAFETEIERVMAAQVSRVRQAGSRVPIAIALFHFDVSPADVRAMVTRLAGHAEISAVFAVSGESWQSSEAMIDGIVQRIDWSRQMTLAPDDFAMAMAQQTSLVKVPQAVTRVTRETRAPWHVDLGRLLGERAFTGEDVLILLPAVFERVVLAIIRRASAQHDGLPAVRLKDVEAYSESDIKPVALARAVAGELVRVRLAMLVEKTIEPVVVLPSLLETAFEPTVPSEARLILRAQWTGDGREVFVEVVVHFAYETAASNVQCAWQVAMTRGGARIGNDPQLFIEVIEFGGVTELRASLLGSKDPSQVDDFVRRLRSALETILAGNASLSVDESPPGP